ncbi:MAG: aminotransferase class IV [Taibaiella sp.]|nr:aminotransferase class IV [Taibaiella sp.]
MHTYVNLNGKITAAENAGLPVDNRAYRYGYGLFETMLCRDGAIALASYHWERLYAGMHQLGIAVPALLTPQMLEKEVLRTVQKNNMENLCRVRLQVDAGNGGLYDPDKYTASSLIECYPLDEQITRLNENGLVVGIAGLQKSADSIANLKTSNALVYALAARQAQQHHWNDALVCNTNGNIIESSIANIFWIKERSVYTPPLTEGCIAGVMRRHVLARLSENNIPVIEKPLLPEELLQAEEVFLTNAIRGIKWVKQVDNSNYINKMVIKLSQLAQTF